jgi:hypothetical protein
VAVDVERHLRGLVPQRGLHLLDRAAARDERTREEVAELWKETVAGRPAFRRASRTSWPQRAAMGIGDR